jgi:hypothetical protein
MVSPKEDEKLVKVRVWSGGAAAERPDHRYLLPIRANRGEIVA